MLRTRHREKELFQKCLELRQRVVIDNTNPTFEDRKKYIIPAKEMGYSIKGYYFSSKIKEVLQRNENREGKKRIPVAGVRSSHSKLQLPDLTEGFDELFYVSIENEEFNVLRWQDEV